MSYKEKDIVYETATHFAIKVPAGYEVYEIGITHAVRCATVGYKGVKGLERAIDECRKRLKN